MFALLSVSDKRGVTEFARGLVALGHTLLSTGGTKRALQEGDVPVMSVSEYTGSPEILGGRVKTLHPRIHGGLLGRPGLASDKSDMETNQIRPIRVLAVNLYPFRETVAKGVSEAEAIEQIDVGGPAMVRAAAKNAGEVAVVVDPNDYPRVLEALSRGNIDEKLSRELRRKAFAHTAAYDAAIAEYLAQRDEEVFPEELNVSFRRKQVLRYGENPHQRAAFYARQGVLPQPSLAACDVLQGKELSYNNLLDLDAALVLVLEFTERPTAVVIKHNTPCGAAMGDTLVGAYRTARAADEASAFGGIVALNRTVDDETAAALSETFLEAIIAPSYSEGARSILSAKKNLRLLAAGNKMERAGPTPSFELRSVSGGLLMQDRDALEPTQTWKQASQRVPSDAEVAAMRFAWRVCKHVKSNAIVFATADRLLAVGGGQTSRVDSARIAAARGGASLRGSAVASDAFFPFRDGVDELAKAGASCVVQPGGSVRDAEVIAAADEHKMAMMLTGVRHFRH
ncbi:MAG: bifunctional phosphoribosylaminoimidazolecarboxamide formyltransferase/IMP cyclohydrolase [Myxococcaceae bacterium]